MWQDIRYVVRSLTKARGFAVTAICVFALGIGINVALFSIVNAVFFRPLPVHEPGQLVYLYQFWPNKRAVWTDGPKGFQAFHDHTDTFASMTGHAATSKRFTADNETEVVRGELVLANYFDVLGVKPAMGRAFLPDEDGVASPGLALVISHRLWMRRFAGDPGIIGREVRLCCSLSPSNPEGVFTIVGVAPGGFKGVSDTWTPSDFWVTAAQGAGTDRGFGVAMYPIARLQPGVTLQQAQALVRVQGENLLADARQTADVALLEILKGRRYDALAANDVRTPFDPTANLVPAQLAVALTVAVAVVLLIGVANIAGLLTARGVTRARETVVHLVLGARIWRVARHLLVESMLLALLGGTAGLLLSTWLLNLFVAFTPNRFAIDIVIDARVLLFTLVICLGAGLLTGLAPALQARRVNLLSSLYGTAAGVTRDVRARLRYSAMIPQVALSLVLLVAAGLQVRALARLELADLGYDTRNVVVLNVSLRAQPDENLSDPALAERRGERTRGFYRQLLARLENVPGTSGVALSGGLPVWASTTTGYNAVAEEDFLTGHAAGVGAARAVVGPGYVRVMGMRVVSGRDFDERDSRSRPPAVIVSETLAQRLWRGGNPLGRRMTLRNNFPSTGEKLEWYEVIGVVNDVDPVLRDAQETPFAYLAMGQQWAPDPGTVIARAPGGFSQAVINDLKEAVTGADLFVELYKVQTMDQVVAEILYPRRIAAGILTASGLTGLLLASIGLFGVVSYSVAQRIHEIGVRTALGANRRDIVGLVLREGISVAALGSALGSVLTFGALRVSAWTSLEIPPVDLATLIVVPLLLFLVIVIAAYVPARRAARVDPLVSLRVL